MAKCRIYETLGSVSKMKAVSENGLMTLSGVFGECGVRNRNNRVYEKSNYSKVLEDLQARIAADGGVLGELEHPDKMNINLENVSHKITEVKMNEDGVVTGTIQLLNTPKGKIAQAIVESGMPLYISSRAVGQIDKAGNVTLEKLSTFDVVSTPGVARARLTLNESVEEYSELGDNIAIIAEKEDQNDNNMDMQELLEKFEDLEKRVNTLKEENESLREELANNKPFDQKTFADGVQSWVTEEFAPTVEKWVIEEYAPEFRREILEAAREEFKTMIMEKFAPAVQKWALEEFAPVVEGWSINEFAPNVQNWITEQFAPEVQNWLNESYKPEIEKRVTELIKESKGDDLSQVESMIKMLEGLEVSKPKFGAATRINEGATDQPLYIREMPGSVRPLYNQASTEVKESISRRAKLYNFDTEGAVQRFWESINFDQIKPTKSIYEGLENIEDEYERRIRAGFRRHRMGVM